MTQENKLTFEQLAIDAFNKNELVRALELMNTPTDYNERKKAFIRLAKARLEAADASRKLQIGIGQ